MKYLYFSTLNSLADADGEALLISADSIISVTPVSDTTLDIKFKDGKVRITFLKGRFKNVLDSIFSVISSAKEYSTNTIFNGNDLSTRCSIYISNITIYKSFDESTYDLYATSGDSDGQLTFTFNY